MFNPLQLVFLRGSQFNMSLLQENQSDAYDCADSEDSCEQPDTSEALYSPLELLSSPLMSTPTHQGGLAGTRMHAPQQLAAVCNRHCTHNFIRLHKKADNWIWFFLDFASKN